MTPEQFTAFLESNERATADAVQKFVNGKIDAMTEKLDTHLIEHKAEMEDLRPIIETFKGGKLIGEGLKWIAGVALAWMAIKGFFK